MTEKSSFKGFLRNLIVEEVPEVKAELPVPAGMPSVVATQALVSVDPKMREQIELDLMQQAPASYKDFIGNISTLTEAITDEGMLYKAAIKLSMKHGHTSDRLILDLNKCFQVLEENHKNFLGEMSSQVETKVGGRNKVVAGLDQTIANHKMTIEGLVQEIARLEKSRSDEVMAIQADTAKIEQVKASFEASYADVHRKLSTTRDTLTKYK